MPLRFDHAGPTFATFRSPDDGFHATGGLCTDQAVPLAGGLVMDPVIVCPEA